MYKSIESNRPLLLFFTHLFLLFYPGLTTVQWIPAGLLLFVSIFHKNLPIEVKNCLLLGMVLSIMACNHRPKSMSFYYWRTTFALDSAERRTLAVNNVHELYTRYFDIDFSATDLAPTPLAIISFDSSTIPATVIPVIYIKNRVFEKISVAAAGALSEKVYDLITSINRSAHITTSQVQFDCDWTETTRNNYFTFLQQYRAVSKQTLSATIRLHQVKYAERTGIPPVDYGSLMYYNMGNIDADDRNSIYDKKIAEKYNSSIQTYPLPLNIALPIFAWGLQVREGKVVKLLNKMSFLRFENDSNLIAITASRYYVKNACFHGGYYFKQGDEVKTEHVTAEELAGIIRQVNRYSNHNIRQIIFYDLDKENLALYDKNVFQQILDRLD